jgi:hypothetical protein
VCNQPVPEMIMLLRRYLLAYSLLAGLLCSQAYAANVEFSFPAGMDRSWLGPEFWANRLQDWQLAHGRAECIESGERFPYRTLHILPYSMGDNYEPFLVEVTIGALGHRDVPPSACAGFLVGAGGHGIDYRIAALVHGRPAEDGGTLAVVNGQREPVFRDFTGEVKPLPASRTGDGAEGGFAPVRLRLEGGPMGGGYLVMLTAYDAATGSELYALTLDNAYEADLGGGIALVSHGGAQGSGHGFWFEGLTIRGARVLEHPERQFGPIVTTQFTVDRSILRLTAQFTPLGDDAPKTATLRLLPDGAPYWTDQAATAEIVPDSWTATFEVRGHDASKPADFEVVYEEQTFAGQVPREPKDKENFVLAGLSCKNDQFGPLKWNEGGLWHPHQKIVEAVAFHKPDMLFFAGDQIYEGDMGPPERRSFDKSMLDYLWKFYRWCWTFAPLTRRIPSVTIPDDHDVYHGNIWGAGGAHAEAQDDGGYRMSAHFINAVQRTQASHLPAPPDATPVAQGISVYYCGLNYGGVSFAVIEDRKWKDSPTVMAPECDFQNGWPRNPDCDPKTMTDVPGAQLLGERQLTFLRAWGQDYANGAEFKAVLSQTLFANLATLPPGANNDSVLPGTPIGDSEDIPNDWTLAADGDSNGWPQTARNNALRELRRAFAVHIAGDQHLPSTVEYGIDEYRDAGYAIVVPAVGNIFPRRWYPPMAGEERAEGAPPYTGNFEDGFGNKMTVLAVANPINLGIWPERLTERVPGYGIIRFDKKERTITLENWPRWVDPRKKDAKPWDGWPVTLHQLDNYRAEGPYTLPAMELPENSVVQVLPQGSDVPVYTLRIHGAQFTPHVFAPGLYTVRIGDGEQWLETRENLEAK